jgi:hypothetical protein
MRNEVGRAVYIFIEGGHPRSFEIFPIFRGMLDNVFEPGPAGTFKRYRNIEEIIEEAIRNGAAMHPRTQVGAASNNPGQVRR